MASNAFSLGAMPLPATTAGNHMPSARGASEQKLGILYTVSPVDSGFFGEVRKRYTDFLVNEVRKDATVVHLSDFEEPAPTAPQPKKEPEKIQAKPAALAAASRTQEFIPPADITTLNELLGQTTTRDLLQAYSTICKGGDNRGLSVALAVVQDRAARTQIHQEIRRIFFSKFETRVDTASGMITATPASSSTRKDNQSRNGKNGRDRRGGTSGQKDQKPDGEYLHFTLYKENRDTMDAINNLARMLKIKSNLFGFAGTKDRRACTTQRMSVRYQKKADFTWLNGKITNVKLGEFSYHPRPIQLGQHGGNDFVITLKNVQLVRGNDYSLKHRLRAVEACVQQSLDSIMDNGFINYFGLQRFGTHAIGTHEIGMKILQGDFEGAIDMILNVDPQVVSGKFTNEQLNEVIHRDEIARSRGIHIFKTTGDLDKALDVLPKRFTAEQTILRHLGRNASSRRDFCGALMSITRGLRNLYIHAYQSLVWNWVASNRWAKHGDQVIKGDLILVQMEGDPRYTRNPTDMSEDVNQEEEEFYQQARALTAEEAASGKWSIYDVVLPIPGYDMLYPENDTGDFYAEFMGRPENGGLDPYNMRRPQREFSLSGHYRKLIASFMAVPKFVVRPYVDDTEQMHPTDLDQILQRKKAARAGRTQKHRNGAAVPRHIQAGNEGRRRTATDRSSSEPAEPRVNDQWVETASGPGSGSKRMKKDTEADDTLDIKPANGNDLLNPANTAMEFASDSQGSATDPSPKDDVFGAQGAKTIPIIENGIITYVSTDGFKPSPGNEALGAAYMPQASSFQLTSTLSAQAPSFSPVPGMELGGYNLENTTSSQPPKPTLEELAAEKEDLFKDVITKDVNGNNLQKAINCTGKWHDCQLPEDRKMKVAIVLNIQLASSNYATICLRELMSSAEVDAAMSINRH